MNFEVQNALVTLDKKTPAYFIAESFRSSDLAPIKRAAEALRDLEGTTTAKALRARLGLY